MITYSKALLLTALGVMFYSGCTPEQRLGLQLGADVTVNKRGKVSKVVVNNTEFTDAGLVHLKGLTSLETLVLDNTQITDAGIEELKAALPECNISR